MITIVYALIALGALGLGFGCILSFCATKLRPQTNTIVDSIDACLPQTQCAQCGYPGCRPYAQAIANQQAPINRCPPGGDATITRLAELLGVEPQPLADELEEAESELVAVIDEQACIGCVKCIQACPVDAIIGAPKHMHSVLNEYCTGCGLCIEPCPVDCIDLKSLADLPLVKVVMR